MNGASSPHQKHSKKPGTHRYYYDNLRKRASALLRHAYQVQSAADLAHKIPLIVGAIVVLLLVNSALQYAAGPALRRALPTQEGGRGGSGAAAAGLTRHIPKGLVTDVVPGGADAELLCVDRQTACDKEHCSKVSVKYQDCKATCNSCEVLRASVQSDTGLQIRIVQELSACQDLHPACAEWQKAGKCSRDPKAMLELCQASCGFCQQQAVSPLASLAGGSSSSSSSQAGVLLDECQDDINVCPFLAASGLCSSGSMWVETQCARSCGQCSTAVTRKAAGQAAKQAGTGTSSSSSSGNEHQPPASLAAIPAQAQGTASPSKVRLHGRAAREGPVTSQAMQEWQIPGCRDHQSKDWYDEEAVGSGLAAAKVPRDQLFLTSKIHPRDLGYDPTLAAAERALQHLRTSYLDLLLLHYPACFPSVNCIPVTVHSWQKSWQALEHLVGQGKVRNIGVSNFGLPELQQLLSLAKVPPSVLESRSDPFAINHHMVGWALQHNMTFIGYSSLGTQWVNTPVSFNPVFNSTLLKAVAARHPGKTVAQVVLRWALQLGQVVIPRSANPDHIPANLQLFDFSLSDAEMQAINSLDGTWKTGGLPLPVA